jgi:hypothetical protein
MRTNRICTNRTPRTLIGRQQCCCIPCPFGRELLNKVSHRIVLRRGNSGEEAGKSKRLRLHNRVSDRVRRFYIGSYCAGRLDVHGIACDSKLTCVECYLLNRDLTLLKLLFRALISSETLNVCAYFFQ